MRTAIFTGSFDPFTIGHDSIVRRALPLFDRLIIGIGHNERKQYLQTAEERCQHIAQLYAQEPKIEVKTFSGLAVEFAKQQGAQFFVRGVRTVQDFEFERQQADFNRRISGIETVLFFALPGMDSISSSAVRELLHFGYPIDEFLPAHP